MDYLKEFNRWIIKKYNSQNTVDAYKRDVSGFITFIGGNLEKINNNKIKEYKLFLKSKNLKIKSINRKLAALNVFIRFLNKGYGFSIGVIIEQERLQKVEYLETAVLLENEFYRIVFIAEKAEDIRAVVILYTLYLTGMRVSEMLQLKLEDVDNDEFVVKGKGSKYRTVLIPQALRDLWKEYLKVRIQKSEYLFTGKKGAISRGTVFKIIKKYTGLARINLEKGHPHALRHLYGYMAIKDGWSIDRLATQMGHTNINTTKIYTIPAKAQMKKEINQMAKNRIKRR